MFKPSALTAKALASDAGIHEKNLGSRTTTLITSNKEIEDIQRIFKSLEESGLLMEDISKTIKNKAKELKRGSLSTF